jgi:acetoin utilization deacetylase AcuC-like enzyme
MPTGFVYSDDYLKHETGAHPERAARLTAIVEYLQTTGIWKELTHVPPRPATVEEVTAVHDPDYVRQVEQIARRGGGMLDWDTVLSADSYEVARLAAGGGLAAVEAVLTGQVRNVFVAARPPGHHARPRRGMGFCLFNNVAIAARYALRQGLKRVFIFDWDVHHGNGTQEAFYSDGRVFFFSIHQRYWYPGTGWEDETGAGAGAGLIRNVPLPPGCGDAEYESLFTEEVGPLLRSFEPELVLVSAGQDVHVREPYGAMRVTSAGLGRLAAEVCAAAAAVCAGRVVAVLEGGYDLTALSESVGEILKSFLAA